MISPPYILASVLSPKAQLSALCSLSCILPHSVLLAPKSTHITPILKSLHLLGLKVNERIEYKLLSLTYEVLLTTAQPSYLHNLISLQPPRSTRSSSVVTLSRPPTISSLKITDRSLWTPAQRKRASMLIFCQCFFYLFFFMAALFSGPGERRFAKVLHVVDLECH